MQLSPRTTRGPRLAVGRWPGSYVLLPWGEAFSDGELALRALERAQEAWPADPIDPHNSVPMDAPVCPDCGITMQRTGTCHTCTQCGASDGCA